MSFNWRDKYYPEYAPSATCKVYPFFGFVMDCDGDYVEWNVKRHKEVIARGQVDFEDVPEDFEGAGHEEFEYAQSLVEAEIRKRAAAHIEKLETNISELRNAISE